MSAREKAAPAATPEAPVAPLVAVRALRPFWWKHRAGLTHSSYKAGQVVVGDEAAELLAADCPHVTRLGTEAEFQTCPGFACGGRVPVATIRAGDLVCENAHLAVVPLRAMIANSLVSVRPGELVEFVYADHVARRLVEDAPSGAVRASGMSVFKAPCPACGGWGLFALPRET